MTQGWELTLKGAQIGQTESLLDQCNRMTKKAGLTLSPSQIEHLAAERYHSLAHAGRIEFGEGILGPLIQHFYESPYLTQQNYEQMLIQLQELFYQWKNETGDRLSDEELLTAMKLIFDGKAQGAVEYLEGILPARLFQVVRDGALESEGWGEELDE